MEKGYEFLVDSREKEKIKGIVIRKGLPHRVTALGSGDFALRRLTPPVETIIGIERKSVQDLVQSIQSKRLFDQCDRMVKSYQIPMLFISGDVSDYLVKMQGMHMTINTNVIYGSVASLMVRGEIQVAWFPDDVTLIDVAYRVCEKVSEGKYGMGIKARPKYLEFSPQRVLMKVPGLTSTIADRILKKYVTLKVVANLDLEKLSSIDGVGEKMAGKIYELFNKEWK